MHTRRQFCRQALGIGATAIGMTVSGKGDFSAEAAEVNRATVDQWMKKAGGPRGWRIAAGMNGFESSSGRYKKTYPIWEVLDLLQKEGFEAIELVSGWPMGPYPAANETKRIDALKGLAERYNLKIHSIQPNAPGRSFAEGEAERKQWLDGYRNNIKLAKQLGCDFIGHWPGGPLGKQTIDQAIDHCIGSYREAARMCADEGMWMSFEIEPPFIFNTLDHLKRILEGVDHPACRTNLDPSHFDLMSGSKGKPHEMLKELGVKHIGHVHLTDCDGTLFGGTSRHIACGDGHCDIQAALLTLWEGGYRGWIMIDGWLIDDVYDACRKGKKAIERTLAAVGAPTRTG